MKKTDFKKLLFKVAFCSMACDGEIVPEEIEELKLMDKGTTFFQEVDLSDELQLLLVELEQKGVKIVEELFDLLNKSELNTIQELIILEIALRIIAADKRFDENEIKFLNLLRAKLHVHDELIVDRFGDIRILHTNEYSKNLETKDKNFINNLNFPDLNKIEEINLKNA